MELDNSIKKAFASMIIISGLVACDKSGPAESAGKKIDQATENVSSSISDTVEKADHVIEKKSNSAEQEITDIEITAKVKLALLDDSEVKSLKITVSTEKGVVTLSGSASNEEKIERAVKLASKTHGVQSVKNQLVIRQ